MIKKIKFTDSDNKGYSIATDVNIFSGSTENRHQFTDAVKEWLDDGNTIEPYKTDEEIVIDNNNQLKQEALTYLNSTDWYFARLAETGEIVPQEILDERAKQRGTINEYN